MIAKHIMIPAKEDYIIIKLIIKVILTVVHFRPTRQNDLLPYSNTEDFKGVN